MLGGVSQHKAAIHDTRGWCDTKQGQFPVSTSQLPVRVPFPGVVFLLLAFRPGTIRHSLAKRGELQGSCNKQESREAANKSLMQLKTHTKQRELLMLISHEGRVLRPAPGMPVSPKRRRDTWNTWSDCCSRRLPSLSLAGHSAILYPDAHFVTIWCVKLEKLVTDKTTRTRSECNARFSDTRLDSTPNGHFGPC